MREGGIGPLLHLPAGRWPGPFGCMFLVSSFSGILMIERLMALSVETPPDGATEEEKAQLRLKAIEEKKEAIHLIDKFA